MTNPDDVFGLDRHLATGSRRNRQSSYHPEDGWDESEPSSAGFSIPTIEPGLTTEQQLAISLAVQQRQAIRLERLEQLFLDDSRRQTERAAAEETRRRQAELTAAEEARRNEEARRAAEARQENREREVVPQRETVFSRLKGRVIRGTDGFDYIETPIPKEKKRPRLQSIVSSSAAASTAASPPHISKRQHAEERSAGPRADKQRISREQPEKSKDDRQLARRSEYRESMEYPPHSASPSKGHPIDEVRKPTRGNFQTVKLYDPVSGCQKLYRIEEVGEPQENEGRKEKPRGDSPRGKENTKGGTGKPPTVTTLGITIRVSPSNPISMTGTPLRRSERRSLSLRSLWRHVRLVSYRTRRHTPRRPWHG